MSVSRCGGEAGYTLAELIVAAGLMILLSALTCSVLMSARVSVEVSGETADLHQRARVGLQAISGPLRAAGAGPDAGAAAGPLIRWLPPIWPGRGDRTGGARVSGVSTLQTLRSVPAATLAAAAPAGTGTLAFDRAAGCPLPCGYVDRMMVTVLDGRGEFDLFVLLDTDGLTATVRRVPGGTGASYARGSAVLPVELQSYYWNSTTRELRSFDGDRADFPVINDVVEVAFHFRGTAAPPVEPRPPLGEENCLYDAAGTPRPGLELLSPADATMLRLDAARFDDGPWCGGGEEPFDADLLRIRAVDVTIRVQSGNAAHRGLDARWFRNPGASVDPSTLVRDVTLTTTIAPRNLGGWR